MDRVISIKRGGEELKNHPLPNRSNRFFKLDNNWYFTTRENFSMGPYDSYELAEKGTDDYLAFVDRAEPQILKLLVPNPLTNQA